MFGLPNLPLLVLIELANLFASALPFLFLFLFRSRSSLSKAEAFSGGVFFACSVIHFVPESLHSFRVVEDPLSPMLSLAGFTVLLGIDLRCPRHSEPTEFLLPVDDDDQKPAFAANGQGAVSSSFWLVYAVLIVHKLIETINFGLADSIPLLSSLFWVVIVQRSAETFALGLQLLKDTPAKATYVRAMVVISSVVPFTMLLVMELLKVVPSHIFRRITSKLEGISIGMAAGVLLFLGCRGFRELMNRAREKVACFGCFAVGVALMIGMAVIE